MKSKKLFAILTLVAFMMTLVPAMAFGATTPSAYTSFVDVDDEIVDIEYDADAQKFISTAKFTVTVRDSKYEISEGVTVYAASSRGSNTDEFFIPDTNPYQIEASGVANVYQGVTDVNGEVEFEVIASVAGEPDFAFSLNPCDNSTSKYTLYDYVADGDGSASQLGVIEGKVFPVEFVASEGNKVAINKVEIRNRALSKNIEVTDTEDGASDGIYEPGAANTNAKGWNKANGLDYYEVFVKVTNEGSKVPVYDQEVKFSSNKNACYFGNATDYTDRNGIASAKVYADKAGTYKISFKAGSGVSESIELVFAPAAVSKIVLKSDDNRVLAKDTKPSWKFELQDANGNKINVTTENADDLIEAIDAVDYPKDGNLKNSEWDKAVDTDNNWLKITPKKSFKKEGSYKSRVTLANGEYEEFSFQIKEQGTVVALELKYPQTSISLGATIGVPTVTMVDADGVEKDGVPADFDYAASDYNKIKGGINANGSFTVTDDKDYAGELVITVFDSSDNLSDSVTITIGKELAGIKVEEPANSIQVKTAGLVPVKFVDLDGNQVAYGDVKEVSLENGYAISKPAGAKISVEEATGFAKGLKEKGIANLEVESDTAGEATIFVNVKAVTEGPTSAANDDITKYYTATFDVVFGDTVQPIEGAAQKVVMFIGSLGYTQDGVAMMTDVAPFIKDGRAFVAVRPIAKAFGVEGENISWDAATGTVTLVRDDITVTIVVGSSDIEVVQDGVVSTITADVPAFIQDDRTVLPFRAVGNAFGVTVDWDETTQSITYEQVQE